MKNLNIVMISQQPWDTPIGSNAKNIALELSKNNNVLYVNLPMNRKTFMMDKSEAAAKRRSIRSGEKSAYEKINKGLTIYQPSIIIESINKINNKSIFSILNKNNNKRFAKSIAKAANKMQFDNYVLINDSCMFEGLYLKRLLNPKKYIYYLRDYLITQPYFKQHGPRCEQELMASVDIVAANSTFLTEYASKYNTKSVFVGQGCELDHFMLKSRPVLPQELAILNGPIIGYLGTLTSMRLDHDLLVSLARNNLQWNFVFVGPCDDTFSSSPLQNMENVLFVGRIPISQASQYVYHFDVCLNPQLVNELTIGNYPLKVDEYLAMGKPVVATKTMAMEMFSNHVYLAENLHLYQQLTEKALEEDSPELAEKRKQFALTHTWQNSVHQILKNANLLSVA